MDDYTAHGFDLRDFGSPESAANGDEIFFTDAVSNSVFHMERMSDTCVWFCITARDSVTGKERQLHVNLVSDSPIKMRVQDLPDKEYDTPEIQKLKR